MNNRESTLIGAILALLALLLILGLAILAMICWPFVYVIRGIGRVGVRLSAWKQNRNQEVER